MTPIVMMFLLGAGIGVPIGLAVYSDMNSQAAAAEKKAVDARVLAEIRAGITVYDVVDGREVNRRPAYPLTRFMESSRDAIEPLSRLGESIRQMNGAFQKMMNPDGERLP